MAKSGQYIPHRSQPLHFSAKTTCGGWYPLELNADESERTLVGQNSTQNPQPLHRSTVIDTKPLAMPGLLWNFPQATESTSTRGAKRGSIRSGMLNHWPRRIWGIIGPMPAPRIVTRSALD